MSYLMHLVCTVCEKRFDANRVQTFCPDCQAPLLAVYDLEKARQQLDRERITNQTCGMWRWQPLLPVQNPENIVTLGEGDTPLLHLKNLGERLGLRHLYVKDESFNPTGSFKARGQATAISKAKELGINHVIIPTAGNAGGAMAAYAARAGIKASVFMPRDTPTANIEECRITGAEVTLINGLISEAAGMVGVKSLSEGWFDVSTFKEPYRAEGKKIMGYELAQAFGWTLPEVIIYPTGGGTGLVAMWKAFDELEKLGWLKDVHRPRMVAVQADGCAPVIKAFKEEKAFCDFWTGAHTLASGLRVPKSFADQIILDYMRKSNGNAVAVSDEEILESQSLLGTSEGIFASPEGAATLSALQHLIEEKWVRPDERIVLFNTGTGLKYIR